MSRVHFRPSGASLVCLVFASAHCLAQTRITYDVVRDFNKSNAPGAVFTYGVGGLPGQFALMAKVVSSCDGVPGIVCVSNELQQPYWSGIVLNQSGALHAPLSIRQPTDLLRLDPQLSPGSMVRFTAPAAGVYDITGRFEAIDNVMHSTAALVFAAGSQLFYDILPNRSFGAQRSFNATSVALAAGDTVDFVVKTNSNCCYLSTGLAATISRAVSAQDVTAQTRVEKTGLIYSRATRQFIATVRVTNQGASPLSGPLHVVFNGLGPGIQLVNRTGFLGSAPYLTLPNSSSVMPGATVTATVTFTNSSPSYITFAPAVFAGSL